MTEQKYKIGDKVLVEAEIASLHHDGGGLVKYGFENTLSMVVTKNLRPYTPRQEFEYGEEVEVSDDMDSNVWFRAFYIGKSQSTLDIKRHIVNHCVVRELGTSAAYYCCRKLNTKPRETITIGNTTYDKSEFENAVKDLKPVEGK